MSRETIQTLKLKRLEGQAPEARSAVRAQARGAKGLALLKVLALVPSALIILYYGLISSDIYEAKATFVVRSPGGGIASQLTSAITGSSIHRSARDTYIALAYMESRDIVRRLVSSADLLAVLGRPEADWLATYPGLVFRATDERLFRHFKSFYKVSYDSKTGIATLRTFAFRPDDAQALALRMVAETEEFINSVGARARSEALDLAKTELEATQKSAIGTQASLTEVRAKSGVLDPELATNAEQEKLTRLALELAEARVELLETERSAPQSARIPAIKNKVSALQSQIEAERTRLTAPDRSLIALISEFELAKLKALQDGKRLALAQVGVELARADTVRQSLFIDYVARPKLPERALWPLRFWFVLAAVVFGFLAFRFVQMMERDQSDMTRS